MSGVEAPSAWAAWLRPPPPRRHRHVTHRPIPLFCFSIWNVTVDSPRRNTDTLHEARAVLTHARPRISLVAEERGLLSPTVGEDWIQEVKKKMEPRGRGVVTICRLPTLFSNLVSTICQCIKGGRECVKSCVGLQRNTFMLK